MNNNYIYGVIPTDQAIVFEFTGFDDVYTVPHNGLAAVVSVVNGTDYRNLPREEAVRSLLIHQQVTERVMQGYPLLPAKFGTVLPEQSVVSFLAQGQSLFEQALTDYADMVQFELVITWQAEQIFAQLGQHPQIVALRDQLVSSSAEQQLARKIELGQTVKALFDAHRQAVQQAIQQVFAECVTDQHANPLMNDQMLLNLALLVTSNQQPQLDAVLDALDQKFDGQFNFRLVGPLPPYTFATIEAALFAPTVIDEARRLLNLPEQATVSNIKEAYRQLAAQHHPDHQDPDNDTVDLMADLTRAYQTLLDYSTTQPLLCDFRAIAVGQAIRVVVTSAE